MVSDPISLYTDEVEEKQHMSAMRFLCEELSKPEEVIRPIYEEILLEMKKEARIHDYLSILVCRIIRDLAMGYEESSFLRLDDLHVKTFKQNIAHALNTSH
ncbi:MAG: DUF3562 domain-containing protein [Desulfobulbaceae bacterium]|nr:DUF3562 domain-containing protein [Desulfobulbaceae bacterium]